MKRKHGRRFAVVAFAALTTLFAGHAAAEKKYGPGVTDTEIKIGQTIAYSGPVSAYGSIGRTQAAYFRKVIEQMQMLRFDGSRWVRFGEIIDAR